jgi:hypothetical protein
VTRSPKILVVSPIPSHPPVQGNSVRILALASELKRRGMAVDLLYYGMEGLSKEQAEAMIGFWNRFFFLRSLPLERPSHGDHWGLDDWCPPQLCETAAGLVATHRYDAVLVNYVWMSKVLDGIDGPLKIIDTHDLFGDRHRLAEREGMEPRWFFTSRAEERRGFARADLVIGIQEVESAKIADGYSGQVVTVGHQTDPVFLLSARRSAPSFSFGYIGSGNPWNVRSVQAIDAALAAAPIARWALAGTICRRPLTLASNPYRVGVVDRLEQFYDAVECVLNPMLGGTGLKVKTIEALSYGRPVIGTRDAFEGMRAEHPFHRLRDVAEVTDAMRLYASSRALREELAIASRTLFLGYMAHVGRGFDELEDAILAGMHGAAATRPMQALSADDALLGAA